MDSGAALELPGHVQGYLGTCSHSTTQRLPRMYAYTEQACWHGTLASASSEG